MEVLIIKKASPGGVLSQRNHGRTYFPVLKGAKSSLQGKDILGAVR